MSSLPVTRTSTRRQRTSRRWSRSSRRKRSRSRASSSSRTTRTATSRCSRPATTSAVRGWPGEVASGSQWACSRRRCLRRSLSGRSPAGWSADSPNNKVKQELHEKIGENLPPGSAGIIAIFDDEQRLAVEQALGGAHAPVGRPGRQGGHGRVEGVARRGDGEVQPGPHGAADPGSELRWRDRPNPGHVRRRLDDRHDAVAAGGRAERVARPDRRRRLREPVDVRRARLDAGDDAGRRPGPQIQPASTPSRCARPPGPPY